MLTKREIEILKLKSKGLTQIDIAKKLSITQPAVSDFYNNSLKKIRDSKEILKIAKELKEENEE